MYENIMAEEMYEMNRSKTREKVSAEGVEPGEHFALSVLVLHHSETI